MTTGVSTLDVCVLFMSLLARLFWEHRNSSYTCSLADDAGMDSMDASYLAYIARSASGLVSVYNLSEQFKPRRLCWAVGPKKEIITIFSNKTYQKRKWLIELSQANCRRLRSILLTLRGALFDLSLIHI